MIRSIPYLVVVLILVVAGNGFLVWRADERARDDAARQACMQKLETTAVIALLAPASNVDREGRLRAISTLGDRLDGC